MAEIPSVRHFCLGNIQLPNLFFQSSRLTNIDYYFRLGSEHVRVTCDSLFQQTAENVVVYITRESECSASYARSLALRVFTNWASVMTWT